MNGGNALKEGMEQAGEYELERIETAEELYEYAPALGKAMKWDALDDQQFAPHSLGTRNARKIEEDYLKPHKHGQVYMLKSGRGIEALLTLRKKSGPGPALIDRIQLMEDSRVRNTRALRAMFVQLKDMLKSDHATAAFVTLPEEHEARHALEDAVEMVKLHDYFRLREAEPKKKKEEKKPIVAPVDTTAEKKKKTEEELAEEELERQLQELIALEEEVAAADAPQEGQTLAA